MQIYKLTQSVVNDYDTYDSCVVIAESMEAAKKIHPNGEYRWKRGQWCDEFDNPCGDWQRTWAHNLNDIEVEHIGLAGGRNEKGRPRDTKPGVVVASFNAG